MIRRLLATVLAVLASQVPAMAPRSVPAGNRVVVSPVIQPRLYAGTNSCTIAMSTVYRPVTPIPTKNRQIARNSHP